MLNGATALGFGDMHEQAEYLMERSDPSDREWLKAGAPRASHCPRKFAGEATPQSAESALLSRLRPET